MERTNRKKGRVLVAMSGGVDSAASALYLLREGYDVEGVTMLFCEGESSENDAASAAETARFLGIGHRVLDCRALFRDEVIVPFCEAYAAGKTPNPCVLCNFRAKFGALCAEAARDHFDHVATGHYVNKEWSERYGRFVLKKADDGYAVRMPLLAFRGDYN